MTESRVELLHEFFTRSAEQFPDAIAIDVPPTPSRPNRIQQTYAQLEDASNRIAVFLHTRQLAGARDLEEYSLILLGRENPLLYAAQLGIMKSGRAYCALDPKFPDAHIREVIADCDGACIITDTVGIARLCAMGIDKARLVDAALASSLEHARLPQRELESGRFNIPQLPRCPRDSSRLAYIIYTSGTTGKPKGVLLEHRGIVNLVESDRAEFGLRCGDRVAQCSSPAYDSSIEETYLAFAAGATLVPLDDETVRLGPDLIAVLREERIAVFCPPPTLLRAMGCTDPARELPDLRLLYVGGEALPQDLADFYAPHCRLENGYGPTECSVTVTRCTISRGHPVTIGRAVPHNRALVMEERDNALVELPRGEHGELCIAGVGLARGYKGDAALTEAKFPTHPSHGRIYRTGDLACVRADGRIDFFGRIDAQVKLRGYRIELGAVEAALRTQDRVQSAAVTVQSRGNDQRLVAFVVPIDPQHPPDFNAIRAALRNLLPVYMVPTEFACLDALPVSIGGKLNRNQLPQCWIEEETTPSQIEGDHAPQDSMEAAICSAFCSATGKSCGRASDFFRDLDGDSLSAVAAVLALRRHASSDTSFDFSRVAVRDIYASPTAHSLADRLRASTTSSAPRRARRPTVTRGNPYAASAIRALLLLLGVVASSAIALFVAVFIEAEGTLAIGSTPWLIIASFCLFAAPIAWILLSLALAVLAKRLLLGKLDGRPIGYWTTRGTALWFTAALSRLIPWGLLHGTILEGLAMRCLGARIGDRVHFARGVDLPHGGFDLLEIGDGACFAQDSALRAIALEDGHFLPGRICVGAGARVGIRAALEPNACLGAHAHLTALSLLEEGQTVPSNRTWTGVPARDEGVATTPPTACGGRALPSGLHAALALLGRSCGATMFFNLLFLAAMVFAGPEVAAVECTAPQSFLALLSAVGAMAMLFVPLRVVGSALLCRLLPRIREGVHHRYSMTTLVAATKAQMLDDACGWLSGSLYWPLWLRLAGARIGRGCEISTIMGCIPEMLAIGEESFFADGIYLAAAEQSSVAFEVRPTSIGARTFIGNHAVLSQGVAWNDDLFVGVSTAPDPLHARAGSGWLGVPAMQLPRRDIVTAPREDTHDPSLIRRINRLFWESLRICIPVTPAIVGVLAYGALMDAFRRGCGFATLAFVVLPGLLIASGIVLGTFLLLVKWVLLGRVRAGQHAFWSCWCSRWDFLYVVWGYWGRSALAALQGTLLLNQYLRLAGARIGKRCVLGPGFTQLVDPDMLEFGDDATIACQFQAHSFEDRILKIDHLRVGARASVGEQTVVFYGVDIGDEAIVRPNGIVMKREKLLREREYCGAPVVPR